MNWRVDHLYLLVVESGAWYSPSFRNYSSFIFFLMGSSWTSSLLPLLQCQGFVLCHYQPFHPSWLSRHWGEDSVMDADHSGHRAKLFSSLFMLSVLLTGLLNSILYRWVRAMVWFRLPHFLQGSVITYGSVLSLMAILNLPATSAGFPSFSLFRNVHIEVTGLILLSWNHFSRVCSFTHLDYMTLDIQTF